MLDGMKVISTIAVSCTLPLLTTAAFGAASGPRFYGDAPDDHHPWAVHDGNRPQPTVVTPGTFSSADQPGKPPSDAIMLFDGTDLSKWQSDNGGPAKWLVKDGIMEVAPGSGGIHSAEQFGDCQLHVEFATPKEVRGDSQGRGNSGVFLMGLVEIQVLDSYDNITYADGHLAGVYGVNPPMVNPARPPGEFQVYDIVFRRPLFRGGQEIDPGSVTVFLNGVLVQDHTRLEGPTGHMGRARPRAFPAKGPVGLQDHGNPTRFRNIWYRPLPPRPIEGGTDGYLTTEATMAKRKEIAASIRQDADQLSNPSHPLPEMLRRMESLVYEKDPATLEKVEQMASQYVAGLKELSTSQLDSRKDEVREVNNAFKYLARFNEIPAGFAPAADLDKLVRAQNWDKKKR
jgi:hypothetical protein